MDGKIIAVVQDAVEKLSDELISLTQDLVRIPSTVGQEGPAQEFMASRMLAEGLAVESFEPDKQKLLEHPAFVDSEMPFEGRQNLIGRWKGDQAKRSIILNGHIDVVSPEPVERWTVDPWGGEVQGRRLYGRGSLDMKGGLAAHIIALKALRRAGLEPGGSVMVQSVLEEEAGGGGGTLACLMGGNLADAMFITEPGSEVCVAHAGVLYFRVRVEGHTAHAGQADKGTNAIGKMYPILPRAEPTGRPAPRIGALPAVPRRRQPGLPFEPGQNEGRRLALHRGGVRGAGGSDIFCPRRDQGGNPGPDRKDGP